MNSMSAAEASHYGNPSDGGQSHQTRSTGKTVSTNGVTHDPTRYELDGDTVHSDPGYYEASAGNEDRHDDTTSQDATDDISRHSTDNSRPAFHSSDNSDGGPTDAPASSQGGSKPSYQHKTTWGDTLQQYYNLATYPVPRALRVAVEGAVGEVTMQAIGATHKAVGVLPSPLDSMGHSLVNVGAGQIVGPRLAFGGFMRGVGLGGNTETRGNDPETYSRLYPHGPSNNDS